MTQPAAGLAEATATYVFAVCRTLEPGVFTGLPGLTGTTPVRTLPFGPLTAVVQHVEADRFTEEAWQERLSDPVELERCARAHHEVVSAAASCGPTVPLALATLYRGDERALASLREDSARFQAALRRIEGRVEWGVKVYAPPASPPIAPAPAPAGGSRRAGAPGAGRAYLDRKRGFHQQREQRHDEALRTAVRTADTVDAALRELAAAGRRLRTHGEELTGVRGVQVLNAAYLVDADRAGEIAGAVRSLRGLTGAQIEMSGPWVPYSFAGEV
jgi:hypothetical protein